MKISKLLKLNKITEIYLTNSIFFNNLKLEKI